AARAGSPGPPRQGHADAAEGSAGRLSFRSRLTLALIGVAVLPLILFGLLVVLIGQDVGGPQHDSNFGRTLLFTMAVIVILAIVVSYLLAEHLMAPLRS